MESVEVSDAVIRKLQRAAVADPGNAEKALALVRALAHESTAPKSTGEHCAAMTVHASVAMNVKHIWEWDGVPFAFSGCIEAIGTGAITMSASVESVGDEELLISVRKMPEGAPTPTSFVSPQIADARGPLPHPQPERYRANQGLRQCRRRDSRDYCCMHREGHQSLCVTADSVEFGCFDGCGDPTRHIGEGFGD